MVLNALFIKRLNCSIKFRFCLIEQGNAMGMTPKSPPFQEARGTVKNDDSWHLLSADCMIPAMHVVDI